MVEKVIRVQNVGKFADYACSGDVAMSRLTLVYAENARGKTTLGAILRSLQTGESRHVEERRTLGSTAPPLVELRADGANTTYRDGAWSLTRPGLMIFDPVFVTQTVYAGDVIEHEQKRNLHRFAIGEEAVRLANRMDEIAEAIRKKNAKIGETRTTIQRHIQGTMDVEAFIRLEFVDGIDDAIAAKRNELDTLRRKDEIQRRPALSEVPLPEIPSDQPRELLSRTLPDLAADAERRVREHVAAYMDARGEAWLSQGMEYVRDNHCPFCGQSTEAIELVHAYQGYFSAAYATLQRDVRAQSAQLQAILSEADLLSVQQVIAQNDAQVEFWRQHVAGEYPAIAFDSISGAWTELRNALRQCLDAKLAAPLERVTPGEVLVAARRRYDGVRTDVSHYNEAVRRINSAIGAKKREIGAGNVASAEQELLRVQNVKRRHEGDVPALCDAYRGLLQEKTQLEAEKETAREQLQQQTRALLTRYEGAINDHLRRFGADFSIVQATERFYGQTPRIDYRVSINDVAFDLEPSDPTAPTPCFRNTLSSGDRTTLAIALFLARLGADPDVAQKVVVFDDPLSSLDRHRWTQTRQEILRVASLAEQVIVLSHDPYFLRLVWEGANRSEVKTLAVVRAGNGSAITEWDIEQETRGEYFQHYFALGEYLEHGPSGDLRHVARCIRPLLEGNLRVRFPGVFGSNHSLGDMLYEIEHAPDGSRCRELDGVLDDLRDIHEYSKRYHHAQNPDADREPINDNELKVYVQRAVDVVGGIYAIRRAA